MKKRHFISFLFVQSDFCLTVVSRCQAMSNQTQQLIPIKEAHFVRDLDKEILPAIIYNQTRAILEFGNTSIWSAGKYRCEITTEEDELVWGWLFVNS